jgi:hypothetical protein
MAGVIGRDRGKLIVRISGASLVLGVGGGSETDGSFECRSSQSRASAISDCPS